MSMHANSALHSCDDRGLVASDEASRTSSSSAMAAVCEASKSGLHWIHAPTSALVGYDYEAAEAAEAAEQHEQAAARAAAAAAAAVDASRRTLRRSTS